MTANTLSNGQRFSIFLKTIGLYAISQFFLAAFSYIIAEFLMGREIDWQKWIHAIGFLWGAVAGLGGFAFIVSILTRNPALTFYTDRKATIAWMCFFLGTAQLLVLWHLGHA